MRIALPFERSMVLCADGCARCFENKRSGPVTATRARIINAGLMLSSLHMGFSLFMKLMFRRADLDEGTTDWRAVRGRTAHAVRRAGMAGAVSDPYLVVSHVEFVGGEV